jgi:type I restriction enzyme S subunit
VEGQYPYVKVEDLNRSIKYQFSAREFVDDPAPTVPAGAIIFPKRGAAIMANKVRIASVPIVMDTNLMALTPDDSLDSEYLYYLVYNEGLAKLADTSTIPQINNKHIRPHPVLLPPVAEQREIAEILRTWDDAIGRTTRAGDLAHSHYRSMTNRLVVPSNVSHISMGHVTREITRRNTDRILGRTTVMGVTNSAGIVPMREQTIATDLSRYHVLSPRAFAYNPMRINVGSIAMSRLDHDVLVSPDYVLFECNAERILPEYFDHILQTAKWRHDVNAGASGSVRSRTYYDDLAAIQIFVPTLEEQHRIVKLLDSMTTELALLHRELELLRRQKRGLTQKLLSGEVRIKNGRQKN